MHRAANSPGTLLDRWHRTVTITSGHVGRRSKEPHGTEDTERSELEISAREGQGTEVSTWALRQQRPQAAPASKAASGTPTKAQECPSRQTERRKENYGNRQNLQAAVSREQGSMGFENRPPGAPAWLSQ